ncbi:hypothetical protein ACTA71_009615 [Dictyostelium dimigraforme]
MASKSTELGDTMVSSVKILGLLLSTNSIIQVQSWKFIQMVLRVSLFSDKPSLTINAANTLSSIVVYGSGRARVGSEIIGCLALSDTSQSFTINYRCGSRTSCLLSTKVNIIH